jgi:deoxyadenosine/deoxycytidine kinase
VQVCGGIAAGKTTLVQSLADAFDTVYEPYEANPFWALFYEDPVEHAFETEVTFLLQHYSLLKRASSRSTVFDFSVIQDLAYADINLSGEHHAAFSSVSDVALSRIGPPQVLVVVECSVDEQLDRIHKRGRLPEQQITAEYLDKLNRAIEHRVAQLSEETKLVRIDGEALDLVSSQIDRDKAANLVTEATSAAQKAKQVA